MRDINQHHSGIGNNLIIGNKSSVKTKKSFWGSAKKYIIQISVGVVIIVLGGILSAILIPNKNSNAMQISQNHSGAGNNIVNNYQEKPQRHIDESVKNQIRDLIPKEISVQVIAVLGDAEAYNFASEIQEFLKSDGYNVESLSRSVFNEPVEGLILVNLKEPYEILVGTNI